jgi:hypothetical protein
VRNFIPAILGILSSALTEGAAIEWKLKLTSEKYRQLLSVIHCGNLCKENMIVFNGLAGFVNSFIFYILPCGEVIPRTGISYFLCTAPQRLRSTVSPKIVSNTTANICQKPSTKTYKKITIARMKFLC